MQLTPSQLSIALLLAWALLHDVDSISICLDDDDDDDDDFYYERKGCVINCSTTRYMTILLVDLHHII